MDNYVPEFDTGAIEAGIFDAYDTAEAVGSVAKGKPQRLITNLDYNLNSPLVSDKVDRVVHALKTPKALKVRGEYGDLLRGFKETLIKCGINPHNIQSSAVHHQLIPSTIYDYPEPLTNLDPVGRWKSVWSVAGGPVTETERLLTRRSVHGGRYHERLRDLEEAYGLHQSTTRELHTFTNLHGIICLMNSANTHRVKSIQKWLFKNATTKETNLSWIVTVKARQGTPAWVVTPYFAYNVKLNIMLDKNFILMLKDICLARMISVTTMKCRSDGRDGDGAIRALRECYTEGDKLLRQHGNLAYRVIKTLEAECTETWNKLGHQHRPLIPLSTSLQDHLNTQMTETLDKYQIDGRPFAAVIREQTDPWIVAQLYGAYRHWGHPYIDCLRGLKKLNERVQRVLDIDEKFAEQLGSEMAFLVLEDRFKKERKWYCTSEGLPDNSPLKSCIDSNTWPTNKVIRDFGDKWHTLNLLQCYTLPEEIDPADMFSDKAHSMSRTEILQHVQENPTRPIPGKRVMETLLKTDVPPVSSFLEKVERDGLSRESLVIGLRPKERELKEEGRFFSLMGWELRLYFVITEYLIKKFYVPLFKGLTMADDLNTVTKKMLAATEGQGLNNYEKIYIANSLDYDKWNNNQRYESNQHVFRVMGKFIGLPEIFAKTHLFFQQSLVYYCDKPELMRVEGDTLVSLNKDNPVCWDGQLGGFEGLRQKGWSVVNYLILRREILMRNTSTLILAQGDNQLIIPKYKIVNKRDEQSLKREISNIWANNQDLMDRVRRATGALGLTINKDEVVTSAELLVYGKIPIYRGKIIALETKRWARVSSVTNDQIPSLSTSLASVTTSSIAVCQHSDDPIEVLYQYAFLGSFVISLLSYYNPIVGIDPFKWDKLSSRNLKFLVWRALYKDPSVGGVCGSNLLRFIISRFPDPVTESLSWWKAMHDSTSDQDLKQLALECGNPKLGRVNTTTLTMLLEDPTSLNIPGTLSSNTLIKEQVFRGLSDRVALGQVDNRLVRESVTYTNDHKTPFVDWLFTIRPVFPRFLSEFYTGTYFRITEGIISTFQNSRTIRSVFSSEFDKNLQSVIVKSEESSIRLLTRPVTERGPNCMWKCSASQADHLRQASWGVEIEGSTVPHPIEMVVEKKCEGCSGPHVVAKKAAMDTYGQWGRGPLTPYLGSKTSETTSVLQPWEKNIEISLLRHACNLRRAIDWITDSGHNVAQTIYNNLKSLTGKDLEEKDRTYLRTGSGKHRLRSARVSNEGNPAVGFNNLMYVAVTTDALGEINGDNYDFMYQSLICWAGILATLPTNNYLCHNTTHFHIRDEACLRLIKEDKLVAPNPYQFPDVSERVRRMLGNDIVVKTSTRHSVPSDVPWQHLSGEQQSWHLGRAQGFLWSLGVFDNTVDELEDALFPISITSKVMVPEYMRGLHRGFMLGAVFSPLYSRYGSLDTKARLRFQGAYWIIVSMALERSRLPDLLNHQRFAQFTSHYGPDVIKAYPAKRNELVEVLRKWFLHQMSEDFSDETLWSPVPVVLFAEMDSDYVINMFRIAEKTLCVYKKERLNTRALRALEYASRVVKALKAQMFENISNEEDAFLSREIKRGKLPRYSMVPMEARKAAGVILQPPMGDVYPIEFEAPKLHERGIGAIVIDLEYQPLDSVDWAESIYQELRVRQIRDPLISGKRIVQLSTGAHYKLKDILCELNLKGDGIFCGDGSGGMGACYLRMKRQARVIFNSLFEMETDGLKGLAPQGPGAYTSSGPDVVKRCVNYTTCYQDPSDLCDTQTWENFLYHITKNKLKIGVLCCDAEVRTIAETRRIESNIMSYLEKILKHKDGCLIYKTYWEFVKDPDSIIHQLRGWFSDIKVVLPDTQGSHTSELYLVCQYPTKLTTTQRALVREDVMVDIYHYLKVTQPYKSEFSRAGKLDYDLMTEGMEPRVPFENSVDIMEFLIGLGVRAGMALGVSERLLEVTSKGLHPISLMYILTYTVTRCCVDIESWVKGPLLIPSSTKLQRMVAALFGIWFGVAEMTKDVVFYKHVLDMYQQSVTVSFFKVKGKRGYYTGWGIGGSGFTKIVDPGERAGVTQTMIRLINCLYKDNWAHRSPTTKDTEDADSFLKNYSRSLSVAILEQRTGVLCTCPQVKEDAEIQVIEEPDQEIDP